jgi:hypothetical protein
MLPLELPIEEFNGREKIAYLPRELNHAGSPGSDPEDGDLIYYTPWGNLGFYYNTAGVGYSDATMRTPSSSAVLAGVSSLWDLGALAAGVCGASWRRPSTRPHSPPHSRRRMLLWSSL